MKTIPSYSWILLIVFFLLACDDPYKDAKPQTSNGSSTSLQDLVGGKKQTAVERWKIELGNSPTKGDKNALVTLVEYSDFECPFCSKGADSIGKVVKQFKGKVRLAFKHFPLSFHKNAHLGAQASLAAHAQGKFWEYHDLLFQNAKKMKKQDLLEYAKKLKLDMKKFKKALDSGQFKQDVDDDMNQGSKVDVSGTPTVYVNGRKGSWQEKELKKLIEEELENAKAVLKKGVAASELYEHWIKDGKTKEAPKVKQASTPKKGEKYNVAVGNSPTFGSDDAMLTIVEFSDFECPFCSSAGKTVKKIAKTYQKYVQIAFKHFPLGFHAFAKLAAQASYAAQEQGKFWEYHDLLFANQKKLDRASLLGYAKQLELDMVRFENTMDSTAATLHVEADMAQGKKADVRGTPALYINGEKYEGSISTSSLKEKLDELLLAQGIKKEDLPQVAKENIPIDGSPATGASKPLVTIVEFSDFECPFCTKAANMLSDIKTAYKKYVKVVFKHYPLNFHKNAHLAAQASMIANEYGKFWQYHDLLFQNQKKMKKDDLLIYAAQLGLNPMIFGHALDTGKYKNKVDQDMADANKVGVSGTPSLYLNGESVKAYDFDAMKKLLDPILIQKGVKKEELPKEAPPRVIPIDGSPSKGASKPLITLVEFSDFQCPFCSRVTEMLYQVAKQYNRYVKVVFKHNPLSFHKEAHLAAQASMAAHEQGKFWQYHDLLFANMKSLKRPDLEKYAQKLSLNMERFKKALDDGKFKDKVDQDTADGSKVGVSGTPTMFLNGKQIKAYDFKTMAGLLNPLLLAQGVKKEDLPKPPPPFQVPIANAPSKGASKPLVTLIEFSDFQCPYCSRAAKTVDKFMKTYSKYAKVVFKHYPLGFHKDAHLAAQASLAAHEQGKFWEYHDLLFANYRNLKRADLEKYAQQLNLNMETFKKALDDGKFKEQVDLDMKHGNKKKVRGTPSFFINGKDVSDPSYKGLKKAVNALLLSKGISKDALPVEPIVPISIAGAPNKGNDKARVTLVEFSDFQCPFCSRAAKNVETLQKTFGEQINIVFKQYPLSFHKDAHLAAQASLAAHEQGKFWEYHDLLFANYRNLKRADLEKYAQQLSMDLENFKKALDSGKYKNKVNQEIQEGNEVGVSGTPTFFINNQKVEDSSLQGLTRAIQKALAKK